MSDGATVRLKNKVIVGLTGNIATGKSAVMRLAADHGALAIDADKVVHEIMESDKTMQAAIAVAFGSDVRKEDGRIDRRALGGIVFSDPQALKDLETIIHPAVRHEVVKRIQETEKEIVFIEAIKLFDGGLSDACQQVWVTRCEKQRQLDRLRICRGMETGDAAARIKAQPPQEEKVALADMVIDTNGTMRDTEVQFEMAWKRLPDSSSVDEVTFVLPPKPTPPTVKKAEGKAAKEEDGANAAPAVNEESPSSIIAKPVDAPEDLEVRRAKPSDIPGLLLLIQRATDGKKKMKRAELLMSLSERGYFIGQVGTDVSAMMGSSIDSQVARVDEIHIFPMDMAKVTGTAVLAEIEKSAFSHMCQVIFAFIPDDAHNAIREIFAESGYYALPEEELANNWRLALKESQAEGASYLIKILMDTRAGAD
ncbi:MAG: dephospho-CoA kinase [Chloroflexota bacterium]